MLPCRHDLHKGVSADCVGCVLFTYKLMFLRAIMQVGGVSRTGKQDRTGCT